MTHAELDTDVGLIRLRTVWNQKSLVQQIPGARWDVNAKCWTLPLSWASLVTARGVFGDALTADEALADWAWREHRERIAPSLEAREMLELVDDGSPEVEVIKSWRTT